MKEMFKIAGAFVGVLVGAGFASGQEILVFFVNFGLWGLAGTLLSAAVFVFIGMALAGMGKRLQATSHKEVVYGICGPLFGKMVDGLITFFMFAVTVVMLAGAGALLDQQFGIPVLVGSALATILVVAIVCLDIRRVIALIGAITPLLVLTSFGVAVYAIYTREADIAAIESLASAQVAGAQYWWLGALLYVSYNVVAGVPILAIMGGMASNERGAAWGGLLGGLILGSLMLILGLGLLSRLDTVAGAAMPTLLLVGEVSPVLSTFVALVILAMILNTAVGMLYSFIARFVPKGTGVFRLASVGTGLVAFVCSLLGFVSLVGMVYPIFGYLGFFLIASIMVAWFRQRWQGVPWCETIKQAGK